MRFAIGLDVSEKHVDAVILLDEEGHKKHHKSFSNNAKGHAQLIAWTQHHSAAELSECQLVIGSHRPLP